MNHNTHLANMRSHVYNTGEVNTRCLSTTIKLAHAVNNQTCSYEEMTRRTKLNIIPHARGRCPHVHKVVGPTPGVQCSYAPRAFTFSQSASHKVTLHHATELMDEIMGMDMSTLLYEKPSTNNSHAVSLKQRRNPCIIRIDHTLCSLHRNPRGA